MPNRPAVTFLEYYRKVYSRNKDEPTDKPTGLLTEMKSIRNKKNMLTNSIDEVMNLWELEPIGVVALGGRLNCLDLNLQQDSPARRLVQVIHEVFNIIEKLHYRPSLWRYISTPSFKQAMKLYEELKMLTKHFIGKAMEQLQSNNNQKFEDEKGVLEKLLEIDEHYAVIIAASDMLFAGVDTVSNTMTATLYFLAKHPQKQNKLREEIMSKQEKIPYLKACIKESMRVRPMVSGNLRKISKDYNIMGYRIPKDMHSIFTHEFLSIMENQYPRPREYIPERWIAEKDDPLYHINAPSFALAPFGFGVRSCIGRRIAELELQTFLARIIENFQAELFGPPLKISATFNYIAPPYNFIFKDVKKYIIVLSMKE